MRHLHDRSSNRRSDRLAWLALLFTVGAGVAWGDTGAFEPAARFARLGRQDGLSHFSVRGVLQDRQGFIWFATSGGLDRYDGHTFLHFRHDSGRPDSIADDRVTCLLESRDGTLWVGTDGGVNRLNRAEGTFDRFVPAPEEGPGSRSNRINDLADDDAGRIWAAGFDGIRVLDPVAGRFVEAYSTRNGGGLESDTVFAVAPDAAGGAWVGTFAGLEHIGGPAPAPPCLALGPVYALSRGRAGELWIGTAERGVLRFEATATGSSDAPVSVLSVAPVRDVLLTGDGVLWVAGGDGLVRYDTTTGERLDFHADPEDPHSLSHDNVTAVFQDDAGTLWAATWGGGVNRLDDRSTRVRWARHRPGVPGSLSNNEVMSVLEDSRGTLWVGTWGGGLNRLDPGSDRFTAYAAAPGVAGRLGSDRVTALLEDSRGRFWIGTRGGGITLMDRATGRFEVIPQDRDAEARVHMIHAIVEDRAGVLWLGTSGGGLVRFDPETRTFRTYSVDPDNAEGIADNDCWDLVADDRWLWIATSAGLHRMDFETERFTLYRRDPEDSRSLPHNRITCLAFDDDRRLWIGTDDGLALRTADGFRRFTESDGLPSNRVQSLLTDLSGRLWMATDVGLARFDAATETFFSVGAAAGAQTGGYFANSAARDRYGRLYFGGFEGLTRLDPAEVRPNPPPRIALTRLVVDGRSMQLDAARPEATIELEYGDSTVAFEFSELQYSDPDRQSFLYRLDGADADWVPTDDGARQAVYHRLRPGTYTFRVRGRNADGVWSEAAQALELVVRPPWWMTWWARGAALALLLALAISVHALRLHHLARTNRLLEETVAERTAEVRLLQQVERHRLGTALESVADGIVITDPDAAILYVNPAFEHITGYRRDEVLGRNPRILQSGVHDRAHYDRMWATLSTGEAWKGAFVDRKANGELYDVETTVAPIHDSGHELLGYVAVTRDVTARLLAERALRDSEARLKAVFATAADGILTVDDGGRVESCNPAAAAIFGFGDPDGLVGRQVSTVLPEPLPAPGADAVTGADETGGGVREMAGVRADGTPVPVDVSASEVALGDQRLLVCIVRDATERLQRRAIDCALEGTRHDLAMAREVQQRLLPVEPPRVRGLDIAAITLPAESVGGDYYDYLRLRDGSLAIVVADASGHGLGPALMMTQTRAYLHGLVDRLHDACDLLTALNGFIHANSTAQRFVTMFLARLDPESRSLRYCAAGHRAFLVRSDGLSEVLPSTGIPLGFFQHRFTPGVERVLATGDVLVLCTDGIEEAQDPDERELGFQRVVQLVRDNRQRPASEIAALLADAARLHGRGAVQEDDITAVVVRLT